MKGILAMTAALVFTGTAARAEPTRGLPRGEEHPQVIEAIFESPVGEVQFTRVGLNRALGHSGFLRNSRGYLMGYQGVRGPAFCSEWLNGDKTQPLPGDCEFSFYDDVSGRTLSVRSGEMTEASLFQTIKGKMRDVGGGL
jgi:hypothetical protein